MNSIVQDTCDIQQKLVLIKTDHVDARHLPCMDLARIQLLFC